MEHSASRARLIRIRELLDAGAISFSFEALLEYHYRKWVKQGDTVIDIGAHVGRHLGPLAECIGPNGRALGFEPLPFAYEALAQRFAATPNVQLFNLALSNIPGTASFSYAQGTPEESGLRQRQFNRPEAANPTQIEVTVSTLDAHTSALESLSFVKIDIEGGEIDCLRGAQVTLGRFRPVVSVEYGLPTYSAYGNTAETLFDFAQQHGYTLYSIFLTPFETRDDWKFGCDYVCWDYFMVPTEKRGEFDHAMAANAAALASVGAPV
ncbi:FkbM family methyltransferase [Burkholderia sp. TSV86]|uniref:FkbM family methyltransferase n=1 Tax=Burkholderia sp. TSV86 TaxID=1385594 RepID=UPI001E485977|nr:FkbM family methyltransferase [Burkholderia sp. TSV86]